MNRPPIEEAIRQLDALQQSEILRDQFTLLFWGQDSETCGFQGCLIGWAVHQQWFKPWGLELAWHKTPSTTSKSGDFWMPIVANTKVIDSMVGRADSMKDALTGIARLWDIKLTTFAHIIYEDSYCGRPDTPGMVADQLRRLLELGEETFCDEVEEEVRDWREATAEEDMEKDEERL